MQIKNGACAPTGSACPNKANQATCVTISTTRAGGEK
ncbi:hypothetical protein SAMN05216370_0915 [Pseudomonas peli]|uniref:Uncharacterized protein n=1 Tax=Pseudomonas peli TaxID=592361 RepID=A0AB37Z3P8_9PSED|nr:hypothetical protein SAMN05216370_0915 [Pseudomonas peli]